MGTLIHLHLGNSVVVGYPVYDVQVCAHVASGWVFVAV